MTDAELEAAALRLCGDADRPPPMKAADMLAELVGSVSVTLLDMWTLLESLEHERAFTAVALLPEIADHLDAAADGLQAVATVIGVRLPDESPLFAD